MKCAHSVLVPLFSAFGIFGAALYTHDASTVAVANWIFLAYLLIGAAVGGVIAGYIGRCCKKDCDTNACDSKKSCG